jgi:hypothetical protein
MKFSADIGPTVFIRASDATYADNPDQKSSDGYIFTLFDGPID